MNKRFSLGLLFGLFLAACAATFPYRYYGIDCDKCDGKLLANEPKNDLPLDACKPDDIIKGKCVVFLVEEFDRLRADYKDMAKRLETCEKSK